MRRRIVAAPAGIALLAVSTALALLGRAVLATPTAVGRSGPAWPALTQVGARHPSLADRAAADLLAADRTDPFREIVRIYRRAIAFQATAGDPRGPVQISRLIPKVRLPEERAQALVMAGTLLAYSAGSGFGVVLPQASQAATTTVPGQARADYAAAIRSDPGSEAAKYDLELLVRQQEAQARQRPQGTKRKKAPKTQDTRRKKAPANGQEHHAGIYATGSGY